MSWGKKKAMTAPFGNPPKPPSIMMQYGDRLVNPFMKNAKAQEEQARALLAERPPNGEYTETARNLNLSDREIPGSLPEGGFPRFSNTLSDRAFSG